jgi:hypothetical protein
VKQNKTYALHNYFVDIANKQYMIYWEYEDNSSDLFEIQDMRYFNLRIYDLRTSYILFYQLICGDKY